MLDLQTDKIASLTGQVDNIDVVVNIHKEKLARREIGALTTNKTLQKQPKIIAPAVQDLCKTSPSLSKPVHHHIKPLRCCGAASTKTLKLNRHYNDIHKIMCLQIQNDV
ncbi:Abl-interactor HHR [Ancylostoma duodenale]|uniref:Abl-interactor HHR n=1 Tax=Ancylostoma duodenale TaxID=51022 RepID=A0A0C2FLY4_9BILA|nr:Abl-interactor HHR [Ancylostoma duodenale]